MLVKVAEKKIKKKKLKKYNKLKKIQWTCVL